MIEIFPRVVFQLGPIEITDTVVVSVAISVLLVVMGILARLLRRARSATEIVYDVLEKAVCGLVDVDVTPLVPLVLTLWLFVGLANLIGLVPGIASPTRDLSLSAALALIAFAAGHLYAFKQRGFAYLKHYIEPNPILLPFNIIGELSRTLALALRLFGNMLSGSLIAAIVVYLVGLLLPVPLLLLGVLTSVVQAYIFGVLTLVFAASSAEVVARPANDPTAVGRNDSSQKKDVK